MGTYSSGQKKVPVSFLCNGNQRKGNANGTERKRSGIHNVPFQHNKDKNTSCLLLHNELNNSLAIASISLRKHIYSLTDLTAGKLCVQERNVTAALLIWRFHWKRS